MLDIMKRGTVAVGSITWEYHGDDSDNTTFYVTPQPGWSMSNGLPQIQIVEYETSDPNNGSGYCTLQVELGVPDNVMTPIISDINSRFGVSAPKFLTIPFQPGTIVNLTYPDGQGSTTGLQADGTDFGSNTAIFQIQLDADQMKTIKAALTKVGGSPFEVQYNITVPAEMAAVTAVLSFDSQIAFDYEVTAQEHTHWAQSSTWTYSVQEQLNQSSASKVTVTKTDPSLPESVVDDVRNWGQATITDMVTKEVQQAVSIQQNAGGTDSFSINQVASFTETYQQNEVILWKLQPQSVLPSFGDLTLSSAQISSLETTVDKRQFITAVTPQCPFKGGAGKTLNSSIESNDSPYLTNIIPLDHIDVTITYPTLTSSTSRTHRFTDNTPFTWKGDWDDIKGDIYSLSYAAVYVDNTTVNGSIDNICGSAYTLTLEHIGTLNVTFDASRFFAVESSVVSGITVDFVFNTPQKPPFLQSATLNKANPQYTFDSAFPSPITTDYIYTVTYLFDPSMKANPYTSDAKQQNGQWVRLDEPDFQQSFNVMVLVGPSSNPNVLQANINFYYDDEPYFPNIPSSKDLPSPTSNSPIQLQFPITDSTKSLQIQPVTFFANSKVSPLTINASVVDSDGNQIQIGPYQFAPQIVPSLLVNPDKQYMFIEAEPTIVDWTDNSLQSIIVHIIQVRYSDSGQTVKAAVSTPPQTITWDSTKNTAYGAYFFISGLPNGYSDMVFDWYAEYIYKSGTLYASGTEQGATLALPPKATAQTPPSSSS